MARITDIREGMPERGAIVILRPSGNLASQQVDDLRRSWHRLRDIADETWIRVELAHVRTVDAAGKELLREMHLRGVDIDADGGLLETVRDGAARPQRARVVTFRPRARRTALVVPRPRSLVPPTGSGVLIRLAERRRPEEPSRGVWLIVVAAATLLCFLIMRSHWVTWVGGPTRAAGLVNRTHPQR